MHLQAIPQGGLEFSGSPRVTASPKPGEKSLPAGQTWRPDQVTPKSGAPRCSFAHTARNFGERPVGLELVRGALLRARVTRYMKPKRLGHARAGE